MREKGGIPISVVTLASLNQIYKRGLDFTTGGKFQEALDAFKQCLQRIPMMLVKTAAEEHQVRDLIKTLTEYILAMRIELERKRVTEA